MRSPLRSTIPGTQNVEHNYAHIHPQLFNVTSVHKMNQQPHSIVVIIFVGLVYFFTLWSFVSQVTEESVLIIKDFGIQLRVLYRSGNEETKVRGVTISALSGIPVLLIYLI